MSTKQTTPAPVFEFVYDSKKPTSLHALIDGKECWAGRMRPGTPNELERLKDAPPCKHCAARAAKPAQVTA